MKNQITMTFLTLIALGMSFFYLKIEEFAPAGLFMIMALIFAIMINQIPRTDP